MKVYRIHNYAAENFAYIEDFLYDNEFRYRLISGEKVTLDEVPKLALQRKELELPNFIGKGCTEVYVDSSFRSLLQAHLSEECINFIPVDIDSHEYWLVNVLLLPDCFDYERSTYTRFNNGKPDKVTNLVLDTSKLPKYGMFRLREKNIPLFVTEALKTVIEDANITGIRFNEDMNLTIGF